MATAIPSPSYQDLTDKLRSLLKMQELAAMNGDVENYRKYTKQIEKEERNILYASAQIPNSLQSQMNQVYQWMTTANQYGVTPVSGLPSKAASGGKNMKFKKGDICILTENVDGLAPGSKVEITSASSSTCSTKIIEQAPGSTGGRVGASWTISTSYLELAAPPRPKVNFDSVVIAPEKRQQILEALEQVNQHDLIFNKWGFGKTIEKGKGVSMLFYGPPGTGKTLMGQAIADHLGYELKVLSVADIESSAPGESERNIRKHFKEAKGKNTILLFDECDSLIYTRAHVGAILGAQINELLSQIERFDGVTIFTTNRLQILDEAVNRRLALKLEFGMPSRGERALIWQRMFPKETPLEDIDWDRLAVVEMTGGYIKNAVLRAARMAAIEKVPDRQKKITMDHLVKSTTLEAQSMQDFEKQTAKNPGIIPSGYGQTTSSLERMKSW